jgi:beta-lactamase regulating signal transducer with metallopeptidase domain/protocatechuate 3,4-dioxygenase beta subunit
MLLPETALGWVVHAGWQAAVLALIVLAVARIPRRYLSSGWRLGLWLVVLARLALPVHLPIAWNPWRLMAIAPDQPLSPSRESPSIPPSGPESSDPAVIHLLPPADAVLPASPDAPGRSDAPASPASPVPWFALTWLAGVLLLNGRLAWLARRLARQRQTWQTVVDPHVAALFQECRHELGIRRPVALLTARNGVGPATCGAFRACIVLPEALVARCTSAELRLILLHELMHVRHWDVLLDRMAAVVTAVHWLNPTAWVALHALRRERELVCDAAVLRRLGTAATHPYGRVLLKVVEQLVPVTPGAGAVGVFGRDTSLDRRIHMIANYRKPTVAGAILGSVLLLLLAILGMTDAQAPGKAATNADNPPAPTAPTSAPHADAGVATPGKTLTVTGICLDEDGHALKGIKVVLYRVDYAVRKPEPTREGTSDADGRFRFAGLPPLPPEGDRAGWFYALVVTATGRASTIRWVQDAKSAQDLTIALPPAATLQGRVTDQNGKPIAGAIVWVQGLLAEPLEGVMSTRTDSEGRYAITDLRAWDVAKQKPVANGNGTFTMVSECFFWVRHPDYAQERPGYRRTPDTINVTLQPAGVIEGRVVDQVTGKPAAGAVVCMQGTHDNRGGDWGQTRTDQHGNYRLASVRAGRYNVWAQAPDRACAALDSFAVVAGKTQRAPDLQLIEGGWLEGRLVDAETGRPVSHDPKSGRRLEVGLYGPSRPKSGAACQASQVDDQGNFRLHVAPGLNFPYIMYTEVWDRTQRREFYQEGIEVKPGEIVRLEFRILPKKPLADPDPSPVRLMLPVPAEREAAAKIRQLGGWYEVDKDNHVIEVNMVYHETAAGRRYDNPLTDTDAALRAVSAFPRLKRLFLHKGQASDDALRSVAQLKDLEELMIWEPTRLTDAGMKHLAGLRKLRHLHVNDGRLGDAALAVFGQLPRLERLSLQGNSFSDDGLKALAGLEQLKSLWIGMNHQPITDAGVRYLSGLTSLEELDLQRAQVGDKGIAALKNLKQLRVLYITGNTKETSKPPTDACVNYLLGLTKLQHLTLTSPAITEQGVKRLATLPNLKELWLSTRSVSEELRAELKRQHPDLKIQRGS